MNITAEELQSKNGKSYHDGYRIVYFYDDHYSIGEYCSTIEGFMIGFIEKPPIMFESEIPEFTSTDDLLNRYLIDLPDAISIAIYKIDGTCIAKKSRNKFKNNTK